MHKMKKFCVLAAVLLLVCMMLAGCGNYGLSVNWYAPAAGTSFRFLMEEPGPTVSIGESTDCEIADITVTVTDESFDESGMTDHPYEKGYSVSLSDAPKDSDVFYNCCSYNVALTVKIPEKYSAQSPVVTSFPEAASITKSADTVTLVYEYDLREEDSSLMTAVITCYEPKVGQTLADVSAQAKVAFEGLKIKEVYPYTNPVRSDMEWRRSDSADYNTSVPADANEVFEAGSYYWLSFKATTDYLRNIPAADQYLSYRCVGGTWKGNVTLTGENSCTVFIFFENLTIETQAYSLVVNAPAPEIGMYPPEATDRITVTLDGAVISGVDIHWDYSKEEPGFEDMPDDMAFTDREGTCAWDRYVAYLYVPVPANFDGDASEVTLVSDAGEMTAHYAAYREGKRYEHITINFYADNLPRKEADIQVNVGDISFGDTLEEVANRTTVTVLGESSDIICAEWWVFTEDGITIVNHDGSPVPPDELAIPTFEAALSMNDTAYVVTGYCLYLQVTAANPTDNMTLSIDGSPVDAESSITYKFDEESVAIRVILDAAGMAVDSTSCKHAYESVDTDASVPATCTQEGEVVYICLYCADRITERVAALGHDMQFVSSTATCTQAGEATYQCTRCEETSTASAPALGHLYVWKYTTIENPDKNGKALHWQKCSRCGKETEKSGHDEVTVINQDVVIDGKHYTVDRCETCKATWHSLIVY